MDQKFYKIAGCDGCDILHVCVISALSEQLESSLVIETYVKY